jgi:hypothetical protein
MPANLHSFRSGILRGLLVVLLTLMTAPHLQARDPASPRTGRVRLSERSLVDDGGPFAGLGASYFTALWRCKNDPERLERDLEFLANKHFNYIRVLSMVGYHAAWEGLEIAPVPFENQAGKKLEAWPDYWPQLARLIDISYDTFGLRTQVTLFADAQLMPDRDARIAHMHRFLAEIVPTREHKIILIEVANEAWQNGFPEDAGVADLRDFADFLGKRTEIPIAITSNHDWPDTGSAKGFELVYRNSSADIATWHFSRDRRTDDGWKPVYDCWDFGELPGYPPVSSNEPIGPGASVNSETEPIRLVMAAAFAYTAKLPMYVFHCEAGVFGKSTFEQTPGINLYGTLLRLLPADLTTWQRNDGKSEDAPFTAFAKGKANRYWPEIETSDDGCVRNIGSRMNDRFICIPIGIRDQGLTLQARHAMDIETFDPLTGQMLRSASLNRDDKITLAQGAGAWIIVGRQLPEASESQ